MIATESKAVVYGICGRNRHIDMQRSGRFEGNISWWGEDEWDRTLTSIRALIRGSAGGMLAVIYVSLPSV